MQRTMILLFSLIFFKNIGFGTVKLYEKQNKHGPWSVDKETTSADECEVHVPMCDRIGHIIYPQIMLLLGVGHYMVLYNSGGHTWPIASFYLKESYLYVF